MKAVNFSTLEAGQLVEVPRTQFAPMRRGWNGWLFSDAVVIRKGISKKTGNKVVVVRMMIPFKTTNGYKTIEKCFNAAHAFQTKNIERAKHILEEDGVKTAEDFRKYSAEGGGEWNGQRVVGCDWIRFLVDEGFIKFEDQEVQA